MNRTRKEKLAARLSQSVIEEKEKSTERRLSAILLHGFPFHYEMIGSIIEQFGAKYKLDILAADTPDLRNWRYVYSRLGANHSFITTINRVDYDLVILDTDDDKTMCNVYNQYFTPIPVYVINHIKTGNRSSLGEARAQRAPSATPHDPLIPQPVARRDRQPTACAQPVNTLDITTPSTSIPPVFAIDIQGIHKPGAPFHFCGYNYINTEQKVKSLSARISVAVIGDIINEELHFFTLLKNRFINFEDIDFYIINRNIPYWRADAAPYKNVILMIQCDTVNMFRVLEKCHYVYFFADKRGLMTSSACFGMAFSTLCRMVCSPDKRDQYEITTPLFKPKNEVFELPTLTRIDIESVENERKRLVSFGTERARPTHK